MTQPDFIMGACPYCGCELGRIIHATDGFRVACDSDAGGCGAEAALGRTQADAVFHWNRCPSPGARSLVAAAARRVLQAAGAQHE